MMESVPPAQHCRFRMHGHLNVLPNGLQVGLASLPTPLCKHGALHLRRQTYTWSTSCLALVRVLPCLGSYPCGGKTCLASLGSPLSEDSLRTRCVSVPYCIDICFLALFCIMPMMECVQHVCQQAAVLWPPRHNARHGFHLVNYNNSILRHP